MPHRHLLEDDEHLRALREFNDLELIGKQVDRESFRPLLESLGVSPHRGSWSSVVGLSPDLPQYPVGGDE